MSEIKQCDRCGKTDDAFFLRGNERYCFACGPYVLNRPLASNELDFLKVIDAEIGHIQVYAGDIKMSELRTCIATLRDSVRQRMNMLEGDADDSSRA